MHNFIYHRPKSRSEAQQLAKIPGTAFLSGGQTLLRDMKRGKEQRAGLVDLVDVVGDAIVDNVMSVTIESGARHAAVAGSAVVRSLLPVLAELVSHIGDPAVRHRGTLGGATAAYETAGDYPAACLGLDAIIRTSEREIQANDFFTANGNPILRAGELILEVDFPIPQAAAYTKMLNPAARYAMVGVFVSINAGGKARVAVTGASTTGAFRWKQAEVALDLGMDVKNLEGVTLPPHRLVEDLFADSEYRAHLISVLAKRSFAMLHTHDASVAVLSHGSTLPTAINDMP